MAVLLNRTKYVIFFSTRSMASSPKASHSPNSSGNKSPVLPIPLALQSNYNNMNGAGSNGVGTKLSPCPSPDYGAMGYLWPPNSPKVMYPNTGKIRPLFWIKIRSLKLFPFPSLVPSKE